MSLLIAGLMFFTALMLPTAIAAAYGDREEIPLRERVSFLLGASGLSWIGVGLIVAYGWKYFGDLFVVASGIGLMVALAFLSSIAVESLSSDSNP